MNLDRYLNQTALYWRPVDASDQGRGVYEEGVQLSVRWTDIQEEYYDREGNLKISKSVVLIAGTMDEEGVVTPDIVENGALLRNGETEDLLEDRMDLPFEYGAVVIHGVSSIPDKNAEDVLIKAYL